MSVCSLAQGLRPFRAGVAVCWLLISFAALADSTRFGADAELARDSNVTRGPTAEDEKSDTIVSVEGYAARSLQLGARSGIVARGGLRLAEHSTFGDLSHLTASARLIYRAQPQPGYTSPWIEAAAAVQWLRHRGSDLRDGFIGSASLGVGSYLTDRVRASLNGGLEKRAASEGALYDLTQNRIWATLDYRVGLAATVYGSLTRLSGDQVFNAISVTGQGWLAPYAEVATPDPALAGEFGGVAPTGYRIEATTLVYELGVNLPLRGNQALDISASYFDANADQGPGKYDGAALRLMYMYRFR
jgi:hypothetical protein